MAIRYENRRTVATLRGLVRLRLTIRRCEDARCACRRQFTVNPTGLRVKAPSPYHGTSLALT